MPPVSPRLPRALAALVGAVLGVRALCVHTVSCVCTLARVARPALVILPASTRLAPPSNGQGAAALHDRPRPPCFPGASPLLPSRGGGGYTARRANEGSRPRSCPFPPARGQKGEGGGERVAAALCRSLPPSLPLAAALSLPRLSLSPPRALSPPPRSHSLPLSLALAAALARTRCRAPLPLPRAPRAHARPPHALSTAIHSSESAAESGHRIHESAVGLSGLTRKACSYVSGGSSRKSACTR